MKIDNLLEEIKKDKTIKGFKRKSWKDKICYYVSGSTVDSENLRNECLEIYQEFFKKEFSEEVIITSRIDCMYRNELEKLIIICDYQLSEESLDADDWESIRMGGY